MFTRVCYCDIKVAVQVLAFLTVIGIVASVSLTVFAIGELKDEQGLITSKHSVFKDLMNVIYVSLSVEILDFVTSCLSFASSCADYEEAIERKRFVIPWVIWCFIEVAFHTGCIMYLSTALRGEIDMGKLVYKFIARIVWLMFCAPVGISYNVNMKEGYRPEGHAQVMMTRVSEFQGNPPPYSKLQA